MSAPTQGVTQSDLLAIIAKLKAELDAKNKKGGKLGLTENGHMTLRGFRKYGMFGFKAEWKWLIDNIDQVKAFYAANEATLPVKTD